MKQAKINVKSLEVIKGLHSIVPAPTQLMWCPSPLGLASRKSKGGFQWILEPRSSYGRDDSSIDRTIRTQGPTLSPTFLHLSSISAVVMSVSTGFDKGEKSGSHRVWSLESTLPGRHQF